MAKATVKTATKTKTAPKKAAVKTTVKTAQKTMPQEPQKVSAEERTRMIELAAYHIAERDGFRAGHEQEYWLQGEQQIARLMGQDQSVH